MPTNEIVNRPSQPINPDQESLRPINTSTVFQYLVERDRASLSNELPLYTTFVRNHRNAVSALYAFSEASIESMERTNDAIQVSLGRSIDLASSINVGRAYIILREKFQDSVGDTDFVDLFKTMVAYNNDRVFGRHDSSEEFNRRMLMEANSGLQGEWAQKHVKNIPAWFTGNRADWTKFLSENGTFDTLIYGDKGRTYPPGVQRANTIEGNYPNWFFELGEHLPASEIVERELSEDEKEFDLSKDLVHAFARKFDTIDDRYKTKHAKHMDYFEKTRRSLGENSTSLVRTALFLRISDETARDDKAYNDLTASVVQEYLDKFGYSDEAVSLWLEEKLKDAKRAVDMVSLKEVIDWFSRERSDAELYELKKNDKGRYKLVKFELGSVLGHLDTSEVGYLQELASSAQNPNEVLFEIARLFSKYFSMDEANKKTPLAKDILKTHRKWLETHQDLLLTLDSGQVKKDIPQAPQAPTKDEQEIKEIEEETQKVGDQVNSESFSGRKIYVAHDYNDARRNEIVGDNLDEKTRCLDMLFQANNEAFSIKSTSIVRAIDWFLQMPESIRRVWIKETINGIEYYKIKRGPVRIFCRIDPETDEVIFFPYQKKAMSYDFTH